MSQDESSVILRRILSEYKTVAVVGVSKDPSKDSHIVARYLESSGYDVVPVNPFCEELLGRKCYRSLLEIEEEIAKKLNIVNIFRPSPDVPPIVDQAIQLRKKYGKPEIIWMQLGIINDEAAKAARDAGMIVVMNKCIKIEHAKMRSAEKVSNEV